MMRTMRASAKWIMAIVAVAFVGWMVFEVGMDIQGQGSTTANDEIARVNGRKITADVFYNAVRNAQEQQRQTGNVLYTLDAQRDLEDQVLEGLVQQVVIQNESDRRGITVTDNEIALAMMNMPLPEMIQVPAKRKAVGLAAASVLLAVAAAICIRDFASGAIPRRPASAEADRQTDR